MLKAYRELEHKGLAAGRPGQGTFIEGTLEVVPLKDQQALKRGLTRWLAEATEAGLDEEGIAALLPAHFMISADEEGGRKPRERH